MTDQMQIEFADWCPHFPGTKFWGMGLVSIAPELELEKRDGKQYLVR